jgi:antitoxin component YwqK of YwqJK toxin-antitoxin module
MKNITLILIAATAVTSSGCIRRIHDPHEVVDQSYIHRYGVPVEGESWQSQGSTGQVVTTLKSGVVVTRTYDSGVLHGDSTYTFPHSDLTERVETHEANELKKESKYYRNGTPSQETTHLSATSQKVVSWYDNGAPQCSEILENGLIVKGEYYDLTHRPDSRVNDSHGSRTRRDAFGNLEGVDTIVDGQVTVSRTFHQNGAVKEETPYVNGQIDGQLKTYLPDGVPVTIETWTQGERTGITRVFENGELSAEVPYVRGVKEGIEKRYRNGKIVVSEIAWSQDNRHGPTSSYIGEVTKTDYFFQGNPVSRTVFEKMNGPR